MNKFKQYILIAITLLSNISCDKFNEADEAEKTAPLEVSITVDIDVPNMASSEGLVVKVVNNAEGYSYKKEFTGEHVSVKDVIPGIYTISVSGTAKDTSGTEYYINGNSVNQALYDDIVNVKINLQGLKVSPLVFKEIYYCGSRPPVGFSYFRDQFYEIYNNSN